MRKLEFSNWNESIGIVFYIANPIIVLEEKCRTYRATAAFFAQYNRQTAFDYHSLTTAEESISFGRWNAMRVAELFSGLASQADCRHAARILQRTIAHCIIADSK